MDVNTTDQNTKNSEVNLSSLGLTEEQLKILQADAQRKLEEQKKLDAEKAVEANFNTYYTEFKNQFGEGYSKEAEQILKEKPYLKKLGSEGVKVLIDEINAKNKNQKTPAQEQTDSSPIGSEKINVPPATETPSANTNFAGVPVNEFGYIDFTKIKNEDLDKFDEKTRQWAKERMATFQRVHKPLVTGW